MRDFSGSLKHNPAKKQRDVVDYLDATRLATVWAVGKLSRHSSSLQAIQRHPSSSSTVVQSSCPRKCCRHREVVETHFPPFFKLRLPANRFDQSSPKVASTEAGALSVRGSSGGRRIEHQQ